MFIDEYEEFVVEVDTPDAYIEAFEAYTSEEDDVD